MCAAASGTAHCSGSVSRVDAVQCGIVGPLSAPLESGIHPIVVVRESLVQRQGAGWGRIVVLYLRQELSHCWGGLD